MMASDSTSSRQPCVHKEGDLENRVILHAMHVIPIPVQSWYSRDSEASGHKYPGRYVRLRHANG